MKLINCIAIGLLILTMPSCKKTEIKEDATVVSPINGLILTVQGQDYTAVPFLTAPGILSDTLYLTVAVPDITAVVKQITLAEAGASTTVQQNATITFINDVTKIDVKSSNGILHSYFVKMKYAPPPFMYFIKTSDKDANSVKYFLNPSLAQRLASGSYNNKFEGYIDLTSTNWDNVGLINSNLTDWYDFNGGWWPEQSSGSFTLSPNSNPAGSYYPCMGPWADWTWKNNNTAIVSPGYWKLNYDADTKKLDMVETQWSVKGTATGNANMALTYDPAAKEWSANAAALTAGVLKFVTIPVTAGDPIVAYGDAASASGKLSTTGSDINVAAPGNYKIVLKLSSPPNYTYTIAKN